VVGVECGGRGCHLFTVIKKNWGFIERLTQPLKGGSGRCVVSVCEECVTLGNIADASASN
jgi:hypothetical protein